MNARMWMVGGLALLLTSLGCGSRDGKLPVEGSVNLAGQPLDEGVIEFSSAELRTGAVIVNGVYHIQAEHGLFPGVYTVRITSGDGRTPVEADENFIPGPTGANIVSKDRIPPEYNVDSNLQITVSKSGPNRFDYNIP